MSDQPKSLTCFLQNVIASVLQREDKRAVTVLLKLVMPPLAGSGPVFEKSRDLRNCKVQDRNKEPFYIREEA